MPNDADPQEPSDTSGAGESALAPNAASSQADAVADMTPGQTPEGQSTGAGETTEAVPSPS